MDDILSFGTWLRRCRMTRGLTQRAFAGRLGYAFSTYRKMEADERRPSNAFLDKLADYIAISGAERASLVAFGKTGVCQHPDTLLQHSLLPRLRQPQADTGKHPLRCPLPPTPLLGRERELSELVGLFRQPERRLVTLVGPPGAGKTHLALEAAAALAASDNHFTDGIVFVPLGAQTTPHDACLAIIGALGHSSGDQPPQPALGVLLGGRRLLLVLDNLEQVLGLGPILADLLTCCPRLTILATSRAPLKVRAEQQFTVMPLPLPDPTQPADPALLMQVASVALFVTRAQAVQRNFQLTHANSAIVAALCTQLDGLPLAIELAAAHIKLFSPATLLECLDDRLDLLVNGPRDLPVCQQSLRMAIERSYLLLTAPQQTMFARLGVFSGSAAFSAIKAICLDQDGPHTLARSITQLIEQHLVWTTPAEPQRLYLLETIRLYACEQLVARGEAELMRERHAVYYSNYGLQLAMRIRSADRVAVMQELERDLGHLRAALRWCFAHPEHTEAGARLAAHLCPFWRGYGYLNEGRSWLEQAVAALEQRTSQNTRMIGGGDPGLLFPAQLYAQTLCALGEIATLQGDYARAQTVLYLSLHVWNGLTEPYGTAEALYWLGVAAHHQGDSLTAQRYCQDSLIQFRCARATQRIADVWFELGFLEVERQHDLPQAITLFQESLSQAYAYSDDPLAVADARFGLGLASYLSGNDQQVLIWLDSDVLRDLLLCDRRRCVQALQLLGAVLWRTGDPCGAVRVWSAAARTGKQMGMCMPPAYQTLYDQTLQDVRAQLDKAAFKDAWATGQTLSLAKAVDEVAAVLAQSVCV